MAEKETRTRQADIGALNPEFIGSIASQPGDTLFDKSVEGRTGIVIPESDVPAQAFPPQELLRERIPLPSLSQPEVVRHFTDISNKNFSIGKGPYPLGSCTMKYNPRVHEEIAAMPGFAEVHPDQPEETVQGTLEVLHELQDFMSRITGMDATALSPMGGAQGELTGVLMIKAYHEKNGEGEKRRIMLVPDSAHGTNPASATMAGFEAIEIKSGPDGNLDMEDFMHKVDEYKDAIAGMMITQPNTLGLLDTNLIKASAILHENGALVYGDGANMNALLGKAKPVDFGIDVMHINTHKAFTTPHGGGGPGAGPVMVISKLAEFLPEPIVDRDAQGVYRWKQPESSIGRISGKYGNVAVLLRAYSYIRTMGDEGLRRVSETAVMNANYVYAGLKGTFPMQFGEGRTVMHEVVLSGKRSKQAGGIARRLPDYNMHPPTIYFPLIVKEAMMIEPTETETLENLKRIIAVMKIIDNEPQEVLDGAPFGTPVGKLDETRAAKEKVLRWRPKDEQLVFDASAQDK